MRRPPSPQQALGSGSRCWRGPCCQNYFLLLIITSSAEKSQKSWNKGLWSLVGAGHWSLVLLPPLLPSHRKAGTTDFTIQSLKHLGAGHHVHPILTLGVSLGRSREGPRVTDPAHGPGHQDTQQVCWKTEPRSLGQAVLPHPHPAPRLQHLVPPPWHNPGDRTHGTRGLHSNTRGETQALSAGSWESEAAAAGQGALCNETCLCELQCDAHKCPGRLSWAPVGVMVSANWKGVEQSQDDRQRTRGIAAGHSTSHPAGHPRGSPAVTCSPPLPPLEASAGIPPLLFPSRQPLCLR